MRKKKILLIQGGKSKEREISLKTGKSCISAIKKIGYKVIKFDPKFSSILDIKNIDSDVIFNALHGKDGEDGNIQCFFEYFRKPYTHSGALPSMIAMNKYFSKQLFIKNKIKTPNYLYLKWMGIYALYKENRVHKENEQKYVPQQNIIYLYHYIQDCIAPDFQAIFYSYKMYILTTMEPPMDNIT